MNRQCMIHGCEGDARPGKHALCDAHLATSSDLHDAPYSIKTANRHFLPGKTTAKKRRNKYT